MAPLARLPPPPDHPVRSPPANVDGEEQVTLHRDNGEPSLEARIRAPAHATRAVVLCHPHPLYGGSMHTPVILSIARVLTEKGKDAVATLRFNFRGVGASLGKYDDGRGETADVCAAIDALRARAPDARITICGHSFGSWTGLRASGVDPGVDRVALVAPSTRFFDWSGTEQPRFSGKVAVFIGDRDEFATVDEARALAASLGATIEVLEGFDHHFLKSRRRIAEVVLPFVAPEAT